MSGNGRGNMRPATKSPPFLIIGLLVVMCILAYNYWTVSSKNGELLSQVEAYQLDFRSVSDKHLTVEKRAAALTSKLSELQSQLSQAENSAAERENRATDLKGQVDSLNSQLLRAQQTLQESQNELQSVQQEKASVNAELEQIRSRLTELQNKPVICDKSTCRDVIRELVGAMVNNFGKFGMKTALQQYDASVLMMVQDLLEGAEPLQVQQAQQNAQPGAGQAQPQVPQDVQVALPAGSEQQQQQQNQDAAQAINPQQAQAQAQPQAQAQAQPQVVGQDPNVIQMQQGAGLSQDFPPQGAVQSDGFQLSLQQQQQAQQQTGDALGNLPQTPGPNNQQATADLPGAQAGGVEGRPGQEIVPQNIPGSEGMGDAGRVGDVNAQEDVADDHQLTFTKDEIDKQAEANHGMEGNLDENLRNQLQVLSKNEGGENEDQLEDEDKEDIDPRDTFDEEKKEEDEEEGTDFDEQDPRELEELSH